MAVKNIVRKGEIACNKQFLLFSKCFLPYMALVFHFKSTLKCRLQFVSIWTSLKFCPLVMGYEEIDAKCIDLQKRIDPSKPALSVQTDLFLTFLLLVIFCMSEDYSTYEFKRL